MGNDFTHFSETLDSLIGDISDAILEKLRDGHWDEVSVGDMHCRLFTSVIKRLVGEVDNEVPWTTPEETVTKLIRAGFPKDRIVATHKHLTVALSHADYRLYRGVAGYPCGTIRITHNGNTVLLRTGYLAADLAQFILQLDAHLLEFDKAANDVYQEALKILRKKQAEAIALEIAKTAISAQLADTLPGLGIACIYRVSEGKVHLNLTRTLKADLTLPLEELSDFLSDPERIEATLAPDSAPEIRELDMVMKPGRRPWANATFSYSGLPLGAERS